ncbi:MAG: DUF6580 family putative transport protein [Candidatus Kapaibacterium sp.]
MSSKLSGTATVLLIIAAAALSRVFHVIPNMAPMTALAVFGAWSFRSTRLAYAVPMFAMLVGDVGLAVAKNDISYAVHDTQFAVYACLIVTTWISLKLRAEPSAGRRIVSIVTGSVLFYVVTNFAVWSFSGMYPWSVAGLVECYVLAIPFFRTSLVSDLAYGAIMFGAYELSSRYGRSAVPVK